MAAVLGGTPARADVPVGVAVGYAFRTTDPLVDDRAHGAAAAVVVDGPPIVWGFSGRAEGLVLAWPAETVQTSPLLLTGGAASLTYLFDDTAVRALASVGAFGGVVVDGADVVPAFGPLIGLTLRFPVTDGVFVDARVSIPLGVEGRLPLAASAMLGLSVAPDALLEAAMAGRGPAALAGDAGGPLPDLP
jgi:hypothetical protein